MKGKVLECTEGGYSEGSFNYDAVIFDAYKFDTNKVIDDGITSFPFLQMESRRIFYSKFFNLMKSSSYRY